MARSLLSASVMMALRGATSVATYSLRVPTRVAVVIGLDSCRERTAKFRRGAELLEEFEAYLATVETGGELAGGVEAAAGFSPRQAPREVSCRRLRRHCSSASCAVTRR